MRRQPDALLGALAADAVAMPVHWYYDQPAIERDYGPIFGYLAPKNPHPDSILWRSSYQAANSKGDILHDQAAYWGERGVHYHQFLRAGENTLNFQLARLLYEQVVRLGRYDSEAWLETYIDFMLTPGKHRDTYVEEYHRNFFQHYAAGKNPRFCGGKDVHIGGLAAVPALFDALACDLPSLRGIVQEHVSLTHNDMNLREAADMLVRMLFALRTGEALRPTIIAQAGDWISEAKITRWLKEPDEVVIGRRLSPTCYILDAFPAALYLAWKYADNFSAGICANAQVGGDSCHRGAVVGSLLALANSIPPIWLTDLKLPNREL